MALRIPPTMSGQPKDVSRELTALDRSRARAAGKAGYEAMTLVADLYFRAGDLRAAHNLVRTDPLQLPLPTFWREDHDLVAHELVSVAVGGHEQRGSAVFERLGYLRHRREPILDKLVAIPGSSAALDRFEHLGRVIVLVDAFAVLEGTHAQFLWPHIDVAL